MLRWGSIVGSLLVITEVPSAPMVATTATVVMIVVDSVGLMVPRRWRGQVLFVSSALAVLGPRLPILLGVVPAAATAIVVMFAIVAC